MFSKSNFPSNYQRNISYPKYFFNLHPKLITIKLILSLKFPCLCDTLHLDHTEILYSKNQIKMTRSHMTLRYVPKINSDQFGITILKISA